MQEIDCNPDPCLFESMRSVGYTLETALADIIDNSIAAQADRIDIRFFNHGEKPYIAIIDNGTGMDRLTAIRAMQLAGTDPTKERDTNDLGRFGLGLKTASLSQARSLLVTTVSDAGFTALRWDLDHIARTRKWSLEELSHTEADLELPEQVKRSLPDGTFTCVLWKNLDKLTKISGTDIRDIDQAMKEVSDYLALVFHRYTNPYPTDVISPVTITINNDPLPPRDPFLTRNTRTQIQPSQAISGTQATLVGYTLPYQNKLTAEDKRLLNLNEGKGRTLFDTQGFYIYRACRLITWGSWFRLLPRKDSTKLSRVRIDIPNSMDSEWTLDIKKSTATPPKLVRDAMRKYVELLAKPSREVQKFRGRKTGMSPDARVWDVVADRDGVFRYEINKSNPVILYFTRLLDTKHRALFDKLSEVLSKAIPLEDIQSRYARDEKSESNNVEDDDLRLFAAVLWQNSNHQIDQFVTYYKSVEPFSLSRNGESILKETAHES